MSEQFPYHGREAIANALYCAGASFGDGIADNSEQLAKLQQRMLSLLQSLSPDHRDTVRSINHGFHVADAVDLIDKLPEHELQDSQSSIVEWIATAHKDQLAAFIEWNTERTRQFQARLDEDRPQFAETALHHVENLIDLDFFPARALTAMRLAVRQPLIAMDSITAGAWRARGTFSGDAIQLCNQYALPSSHGVISSPLLQTTFHEYLHASGHAAQAGFLFYDTPIQSSLFEESFVEHAVVVARNHVGGPQQHIIHPDERLGLFTNTYRAQRQTLALLSGDLTGNIPAEEWAAAYYDNGDMRYQVSIRNRLESVFASFNDDPRAYELFIDTYDILNNQNNGEAVDRLLFDTEMTVMRQANMEVFGEIDYDNTVV